MDAEQAPVQVGQFILAKNLGIGAFGKVRLCLMRVLTPPQNVCSFVCECEKNFFDVDWATHLAECWWRR